ncbi:PREDICTED: rRNA 2'-O-methyltransferase fibrillarin-like [Nelumbo nucifera]|uniref:rRNA 2'-O-methyltransferase fibrillarin-like n=1 Tax=Nelumbo nucifera TaxID=4432 RepID=A0A1U8Q212_NELNU|nr:PREDICTED: rRNA 2'-O-methyltransferase fibrillarin-like [Nelumbo nucifera]
MKSEYEPVRAQIFGGSALPSLEEVFARIRGGRGGQHGRGSGGGPMYGRGGGGMYNHGGGRVRGRDSGGARGREHGNTQRRCTHCGTERHTINFFYDLHGPPSTWANRVAVNGGSSRQESQVID